MTVLVPTTFSVQGRLVHAAHKLTMCLSLIQHLKINAFRFLDMGEDGFPFSTVKELYVKVAPANFG